MDRDYKSLAMEEFKDYCSHLRSHVSDSIVPGLATAWLVEQLASARKERDEALDRLAQLNSHEEVAEHPTQELRP